MKRASIVFHLPGSLLDGRRPMPGYYQHLLTDLGARGAVVDTVVHERVLTERRVRAGNAFHIVDHGNFRHPRVLNTGVAYIFPFWNLDPWGIRAGSSIAAKIFDAQSIPADQAQAFVAGLCKRLIGRRISRGHQPQEKEAFPNGSIAVFLQSEGHRQVEETCYLHRENILKSLMRRDDPRHLIVKIHPRDHSAATREWLAGLAASDRRLIVTEANIHDILASADVTVTINSAVGVESMLHHVPVVLCGQSDFHHCSVVVRSADEMEQGLQTASETDWPFTRFLFWYFRLNCLAANSPTLTDDFIARIAKTGYDVSQFGVSSGLKGR
jgi:hypothetical protein